MPGPASLELERCHVEYLRSRKRLQAPGARPEFTLRLPQCGHIPPPTDRLPDRLARTFPGADQNRHGCHLVEGLWVDFGFLSWEKRPLVNGWKHVKWTPNQDGPLPCRHRPTCCLYSQILTRGQTSFGASNSPWKRRYLVYHVEKHITKTKHSQSNTHSPIAWLLNSVLGIKIFGLSAGTNSHHWPKIALLFSGNYLRYLL